MQARCHNVFTSARWAILVREGTNPLILGVLGASVQNLVSRLGLLDGLAGTTALDATWNSRFTAYFMGHHHETTRQVLLVKWGHKLVMYVTALAAAADGIQPENTKLIY
jgi:hypothetical protein